ncbi:beta-lactamase family protein [Glaciecola sp. XM2]|jgi:CubicO group peptidase (beta-lactamase class C family)|uniref:serine hydrolase domain-containing protein n=1 Tax=Glaciecola sp. XM2 TaxID=1914931 RepID=UPI001BDE1817|nr:serine hydrolase [Glaciecola sp. XM2]MBT1451263.1 beta-lactamase family protein [Glaciecola sp. XM2]
MNAVLKWVSVTVISLAILFGAAWWYIGSDWRGLLSDLPTDANVLFWSQNQREYAFKMMDQLPALAQSSVIAASDNPKKLGEGEAINFNTNIEQFFDEQSLAGMLVLHKGDIRFERYGLGHSPEKRWTSFSVAKSFTASLVGIALKEGHISSLDDSVSQYIEDLKGSVYDGVSVSQLLTMTSGVKWNESYTDPQSDVALFNQHKAADGLPTIVSYMQNAERAHPAEEKWLYSTGETNLIGILVEQATGVPIAQYLTEKIWQPYGMADQASWLLGADGNEISGCCIQASLRDYARYGLFVLDEGKIDGQSILPEGFLAAATTKQADIGSEGKGYGYQWWTFDDGTFTARGIFGQTIFIDPTRQLVVAMNGNWPNASEPELNAKRFELINEIQNIIDQENVSN